MNSIYEKIKATGAYISNHESDLYCEITPETRAIVDAYKFKGNVTTFRNQVTGALCFEIPFAYDPYWQSRCKHPGMPPGGECNHCGKKL